MNRIYQKSTKFLISYAPYIITVLLITLPWFLKSGFLFFTDFSWGPRMALSLTNSDFLFSFIIKGLSFILPVDLIQKLFISLTLLIILLGGKKIAEYFILDKTLVFIVSLFTLFNPFVYDRLLYGQIEIVLALGFLCFTVGYLLSYLKNKQNREFLLFCIFSALTLQFSIVFVFILLILIICLLLIHYSELKKITTTIHIQNIIWFFAILFILNFFFILATLTHTTTWEGFINPNIDKQHLAAFQTAGNGALDTAKNVLMMAGFWGAEQYRYVDLKQFPSNLGRSFILLLPLICWGWFICFRSKDILKRRLAIGLLILFGVSAFLAIGIKSFPSKLVTIWLFDHVYFYRALREPQKWVSLIVLVYSIFLAFGLNEFFQKRLVQKNNLLFKILLVGIIVMQAPLLIWGFGGQAKPTNYPEDWATINQIIIRESNCQNKTLFLPWHLYMSFEWIGKIIANPAKNYFKCPIISGTNMEFGGIYDNNPSKIGKAVQIWLESNGKINLNATSGENFQYIILAKELDWQGYNWLDDLQSAKLLKETKTLKLFELHYE